MKDHLESLGRVKLQGVLLLAVVFAIGAFAGAAFERARQARWGPPPHAGHGTRPGWLDKLQLTDAQEQQIHRILERNRPRTDSILDQLLPRLRAVSDSARAEVRAVLTREQQEIFDRLRPSIGPPLHDGRPSPERPPPGGPPPPDNSR